MYHIAVCDDNEEYLSRLKEAIWSCPEYNADNMTVDTFHSGEEFLREEVSEFQLVFLDMQMGELDGYQTAQQIRERNERAVLAFCSGVVMPLPEHFLVQPYRYFMKHYETEKVAQDISELLQEMVRRFLSRIEVVSDGKAMRIEVDRVLYIERQKRGSRLVIEEAGRAGERLYGEVMSNEGLEQWYAQLESEGFEYVHKSFLVNMKNIVAVVKETVLFANGMEIKITRTYKQKFTLRFSHYFSKKYRRNT